MNTRLVASGTFLLAISATILIDPTPLIPPQTSSSVLIFPLAILAITLYTSSLSP